MKIFIAGIKLDPLSNSQKREIMEGMLHEIRGQVFSQGTRASVVVALSETRIIDKLKHDKGKIDFSDILQKKNAQLTKHEVTFSQVSLHSANDSVTILNGRYSTFFS